MNYRFNMYSLNTGALFWTWGFQLNLFIYQLYCYSTKHHQFYLLVMVLSIITVITRSYKGRPLQTSKYFLLLWISFCSHLNFKISNDFIIDKNKTTNFFHVCPLIKSFKLKLWLNWLYVCCEIWYFLFVNAKYGLVYNKNVTLTYNFNV